MSVTLEHVKFDTQLIDNLMIYGKKYQQGALYRQNLWQYLLDRDAHTCQYCNGSSSDNYLTKEHKTPKCQGGSDSPNNLCVACNTCNQDKSGRNQEQYLSALKSKKRPNTLNIERIRHIEKIQASNGKPKKSTRHNAVMNQLRWLLKDLYDQPGIILQLATSAQTALNRKESNLKNIIGLMQRSLVIVASMFKFLILLKC